MKINVLVAVATTVRNTYICTNIYVLLSAGCSNQDLAAFPTVRSMVFPILVPREEIHSTEACTATSLLLQNIAQ